MANIKSMEDILSDLGIHLDRRPELLRTLRTYREGNPSYRNGLIKTWTPDKIRRKARLLASKWLVEDGNGARFWTPGKRRNQWPRNQIRIQGKIAEIMARQMIKKAQRVRLSDQKSPELSRADSDVIPTSTRRKSLRRLERPNYVERATTDIFLEYENLPQTNTRTQAERADAGGSHDRPLAVSIEESDWEPEHESESESERTSLATSKTSALPRLTVNVPCGPRQLTRFTPPPSEQDSDEDHRAASPELPVPNVGNHSHIAPSPFRNRWTAVNGRSSNQPARNPVSIPQDSGRPSTQVSAPISLAEHPQMMRTIADTPALTPPASNQPLERSPMMRSTASNSNSTSQAPTQDSRLPFTDATGKLFLELELQKMELNRQRLELDRERTKFDREEKRQRRQADQEYKSQKMEYQKKVLDTQQQMLEILQRDSSHQRRKYAEFRCRLHNKTGCGTCQASLMCLDDPITCQTRILSASLPVRS